MKLSGGERGMKVSTTFSQVRPFTENDIEQVSDLHRRGFRVTGSASPELFNKYRTYFSEVFLKNPWSDCRAGALVHEESDGAISGFIGSVMRPMVFKGERIRARMGTQFIVDPRKRGFAGLKLLRAFFDGPQDLTIGDEGNTSSRGLWEAFGGFTLLLYSMHWYYPLRPCESMRRVLMSFGRVPPLAPRIAAPLARMVDSIAAPALTKLVRRKTGRLIGQDPSPAELAACVSEADRNSLRPEYDERSLEWLLGRARRLRPSMSLQKRLLKTEAGQTAGWYVFVGSRGAPAEVLQLHASAGFEDDVLECLFEHARAEGAAALVGRMEPAMAQVFSDKRCPLQCGPHWVLVHSRRPELLGALLRGEAFLSRLEGEWCLRFQ